MTTTCIGAGRLARRRLLSGIAALALGATAAVAPAAGAAGPAVQPLGRLGYASYWAFVDVAAVARAAPSPRAPAVARLRTTTPDGTDDLVAVLARTRRGGRLWLRVRLPVLPNGSTGWMPAGDLSSLRAVHTWLRVDRTRERMTLIRAGRVVFTARVGVGRPQTPTPAGNFYVLDELTGFPPGTVYGALAFGTSARSAVLTDWPKGGVIGIHGTDQPQLIPGRVSHGCIRMRNPDILRLARLLPIGTPITIT